MQTSLYHLAANQPCKYPKSSEEDANPHVVKLKDTRENRCAFRNCFAAMICEHSVHEQDERWGKRKEVNPERTP
jgi:hypothetical protein